MKESSIEITKLCESWWGKLADSTKVDQSRYAEQLLGLLGWQNPAPLGVKSTPTAAREEEGHSYASTLCTASYVLRESAHAALAAHFVMPGALEPPSNVIQRGLDFCETTRWLVDETRSLNIDYAFITDMYRSYFYDVRNDDLLLTADSPAEFKRDFVDLLTRNHVERGSLDEVRRQPRSYAARQLREWCHHWSETFVAEAHISEELAHLALDRLFVLRYLFDHDILKRTGWRLRRRFTDLVAHAHSTRPLGCGRLLRALYHDIWFDWKADLFTALPELDAAIERDSLTAPLLREFSLLSRSKFSIATILESFNYGDAAEKARVRMVPDLNEDRETYFAKQTVDTIDTVHIEIDLADEGYRAIFHWFDKLVSLYERLEVEFDLRTLRSNRPSEEMDLFAWSEIAEKRPNALADKFQHVIEHGLTVYHSSPRQLRIARLMLYLHIISRYDQTKQRFVQFPKIRDVFKARPRVLENDRKRIFQSNTEEEWYL